jgi:hypothetical protein
MTDAEYHNPFVLNGKEFFGCIIEYSYDRHFNIDVTCVWYPTKSGLRQSFSRLKRRVELDLVIVLEEAARKDADRRAETFRDERNSAMREAWFDLHMA